MSDSTAALVAAEKRMKSTHEVIGLLFAEMAADQANNTSGSASRLRNRRSGITEIQRAAQSLVATCNEALKNLPEVSGG